MTAGRTAATVLPRVSLDAGPAGRGALVHGEGVLARLGVLAAGVVRPGPCLVMTDRTVSRLHGPAAGRALLRAGFRPRWVVLAPGERSKVLGTVAAILASLARLPADRSTPVFALGGGVVTDLAGFAAALYARGLPWVAVPTTVLAMADAAVGGKTGVDLPEGKNLAGAFHLPVLVASDPAVLATLPARHVRNGLAEVAKMDLLGGIRRGLPRVEALAAAASDAGAVGDAAFRAACAKAAVVARDPLDRNGRRALLNLGHTVGHALEAATGFDGSVLHGEAVVVGIAVAARVAEARGLLARGEAGTVAAALASLGLKVALPAGVRTDAVLRRCRVDKKRERGALRMVLPRSRGGAVVVPVSVRELRAALRR